MHSITYGIGIANSACHKKHVRSPPSKLIHCQAYSASCQLAGKASATNRSNFGSSWIFKLSCSPTSSVLTFQIPNYPWIDRRLEPNYHMSGNGTKFNTWHDFGHPNNFQSNYWHHIGWFPPGNVVYDQPALAFSTPHPSVIVQSHSYALLSAQSCNQVYDDAYDKKHSFQNKIPPPPAVGKGGSTARPSSGLENSIKT